jgi:hypothetical protein
MMRGAVIAQIETHHLQALLEQTLRERQQVL